MQSIFKTKDGTVVIGQFPNTILWIWIVCTAASYLPLSETLLTLIDAIAFGSIFTWAWLEMTEGVNTFRRMLGMVVLVAAVWFRVVG
jgi:hypothetical protein